ncbi:hypothetical protein GJAV_G00088660 [Gymnothorax javanicus]|nr:hypothetical protein GJAV_G00088660 [Gymnothorax javanicus]
MQAGVRLRQDTETTLPELPEQHRIREKEEELHGLESVHMAESETKCTAPGLNTLQPECVTANSRVSDLHHTEASLIKTEADLSSSNTGDLKTESIDFTDLTYGTHLHLDQVKTKTESGDYIKPEHISVSQDIKCVVIKSDEVKFESSDVLVSDLMNPELKVTGADEKGQREPWQCGGEPNKNNRKSEKKQSDLIQDVAIHLRETTHPCTQGDKCSVNKYNLHQWIISDGKPYKCDQCETSFSRRSHLQSHQKIHRCERPYKSNQCWKTYFV